MSPSDSSAGQSRWSLPLDLTGADAGGKPWREIDWSMAGQFLNRFPVGIAVMSPDLRYLWINDALERIGGVPRAERLGKRLSDVLPGLDTEPIEGRMRKVLETGRAVTDYEYRGRTQADPDREHAYSTSFFRLDDDSGRALGVCYMVLDVTDRWRARERLALLNEAGARIGSTLDVTRTAQDMADICVPWLADFTVVDLLSPVLRGEAPSPGTPLGTRLLHRSGRATVAEDRHKARGEVGETVEFPPFSPGARSLADGTSYFCPVLEDEHNDAVAAEPPGAGTGAGLGACSLMLVPVGTRETTLGVATFIRWRPHDPFERDDLLLAEEIAARAAVYIENASQYAREHSTALALQQELLPHMLATHPTLEFASRYLPADAGAGVGGDWFDVIPLSGARVALVVGDVVGHGINAAVSMGRIRTAVRTLADMDLPPEELLAHLDDLLLKFLREEPAREKSRSQAASVLGASCLYLVYDPVLRTCAMARSGHPPPGIVTPDGSVTFPDLPPGPPLGLGGLPFESAEFELADGSVLALYTDGLIESRDRDVDSGLARLRTALSSPGLPLEEQCTAVLDSVLADRGPEDDVALLLARTHALAADQVATWDLPADPAVVTHARALASHCLDQWDLSDAAFNVELIVSELVTNAIRHASGPLRLRLIRHTALICEVYDASSTSPRLHHARTTDEGGRGLFLVAQIAERWGTRYTGEGKIIWAEYDLPTADGSDRTPGGPVQPS
ncbi:SpoIIE family protein phosphatase [Streptomyces bathyalis]|uniref:SpoIIE family protein phosphatase n=1 Tax=Streptomyces bathyalis TaxID=2710756 RepID=A0A7T1WPT2_9ACTN|nr:SpoIIE family protein phosphatase [Streptomyces bathyalis]QPP05273.1 SpoIIE family protein phosphatase [Streptomyces bathyalis]